MPTLTQSLPFKGVKKDYNVMMTNANKNNDVIYFHLPSGDFGRSTSHWVKEQCLSVRLSVIIVFRYRQVLCKMNQLMLYIYGKGNRCRVF